MLKVLFVIAMVAFIFCLWMLLLFGISGEEGYPDIKDL